MTVKTAIDAHVHIHIGVDVADVLEAAARNVARYAGQNTDACLLLTEIAGVDRFGDMRDGREEIVGWELRRPADDPAALTARRGADRVHLIAGRQHVTAERIEVLALAMHETLEDGAPLDETIDRMLKADVAVVLPWGVGKWWGSRGRRVSETIAQADSGLMLGDNQGRPVGWPTPPIFTGKGSPVVLPGTDPLPIPGTEAHVGSYGFLLEGALDDKAPSIDLSSRLRSLRSSPKTFGKRHSPWTMLVEQIAMRRAKRQKREL